MLRLTTRPPSGPQDMDVLRIRRAVHAPVDRSCPVCGSLLDAPRVNPATGRRSRKCTDCTGWQPFGPPAR